MVKLDREALVRLTSAAVKPVTASLNVAVIVCAPVPMMPDNSESDTVGATRSNQPLVTVNAE